MRGEAQNNVDSQQVGKTTVGALEKTMSNGDRSLSGGKPGELRAGRPEEIISADISISADTKAR
jgi:hypothetical protein